MTTNEHPLNNTDLCMVISYIVKGNSAQKYAINTKVNYYVIPCSYSQGNSRQTVKKSGESH